MDLSFSGLFANLLFSLIGLIFFRRGKKEAEYNLIFLGLALMIFPYFVENHFLLWGIGLGLTGWGYYKIKGY